MPGASTGVRLLPPRLSTLELCPTHRSLLVASEEYVLSVLPKYPPGLTTRELTRSQSAFIPPKAGDHWLQEAHLDRLYPFGGARVRSKR